MLLRIGCITLVFVLMGIFLATTVHADHCGSFAGTRHPTAQEVQGGVPAGSCYRPTDRGVTVEATRAKLYLLQNHNGCSRGRGITGENGNNCILRLNDTFATKLAQLFQSNPQGLFTNIKIDSGYRTREGNGRVGGASDSRHLYGCAVDLTGSPNVSKPTPRPIHRYIATHGPALGLKALFIAREYNHFELANCSSSAPPSPPPPPPVPANTPIAGNTGGVRGITPPPPRPLSQLTLPWQPQWSGTIPPDGAPPPGPRPLGDRRSAIDILTQLAGFSPPTIGVQPPALVPAVVINGNSAGYFGINPNYFVPALSTGGLLGAGPRDVITLQASPPPAPDNNFISAFLLNASAYFVPFRGLPFEGRI